MTPAFDVDSLLKHRGWVLMAVLVVVAVAFALVFGSSKQGGAKRPHVIFGARVEQLGATSDLIYTNGWVASSGGQLIGVYAGSQRQERHNGLFVIVRQNGKQSRQKVSRVVVHGSGALTMLRPATPATQDAAFQTTVRFITANGTTGILDLGNGDKVTLSG